MANEVLSLLYMFDVIFYCVLRAVCNQNIAGLTVLARSFVSGQSAGASFFEPKKQKVTTN